MKRLFSFACFVFCICALVFALAACGGGEVPGDGEVPGGDSPSAAPCSHVWGAARITTVATKTQGGVKTSDCTLCGEKKTENYSLVAPTAAAVYAARQKVVAETVEGYDFSFSLGADFSVLGLSKDLVGNYTGMYRNNKTTGDETFFRSMSGALFFDSSAFSYDVGDKKIRIDCDEDGNAEKASVLPNNDEGFFANKAIVELVNSIKTNNIKSVSIDARETDYDFVAILEFESDNAILSKIMSLLGNFGTRISFKNISFVNPTAIPIHFNIDENGRMNDFEIELDASIKIKLAKVNLFVRYEQHGENAALRIPDVAGLSVDSEDIESDLAAINSAIFALKNSDAYSLDMVASNEFDPSWNKLATVDKYVGRLYKNTVDDDVWFNHSYKFKAHHEEDGAETYKYTIGNITDNTTYLISRKGSNVITPVTGYSADSQFDFMVGSLIFSSSQIDCVSSKTNGDTTVYTIHLNNQSAISVQQKIINIINSNDADGVVDVDNYISDEIAVAKAVFTVTLKNGALCGMEIKTDLKYNPTDGEYTDYNITLTNKIELEVNEKLSDAQDYEAPSKPESNFLGIGGLKYIL